MKAITKNYLLPVALALLATNADASCGSAFCSVDTHWDTQGLSSDEGLRVDLRYSYTKADKFRAGSSKITAEAPSGSGEEIEDKRTINQVFNLDAEYAINERWNSALDVPLVRRDHTHTFDSLAPDAPIAQQAKFTELGDIVVVGKYKFDMGGMQSGSGIRFGLKLPTGAIDKTMTPPDPAEPATPFALERSAQPGSGSTDAILGAYYFRNLPGTNWGWFASGQIQSAIATRDDFRPGSEVRLDLGTHYALSPDLSALLQLNVQHRERDKGSNANPASGGYALYLSPGLSYAITPKTQVYGLVQLALKQYANTDPDVAGSGQLTAPWSLAVGISHRY
jgi:hypothetical protein